MKKEKKQSAPKEAAPTEIATTAPAPLDYEVILSMVASGDTSKLTDEQKIQYYKARCDAAGLDWRAQPFEFIKLNGKEVLYARKAATEQLSAKHKIICEIVEQKTEADVRSVTVRARTADGRQTDEIGCVSVINQKGETLANAYMKAVTKAKRRAILSLCGLGMVDETELETIPAAARTTAPIPATPPAPRGPGTATTPPPPVTAETQKAGAGLDPHSPIIIPASAFPNIQWESMRVGKLTQGNDGRFKVYDPANNFYFLRNEAMAKEIRSLVGRVISFKSVALESGRMMTEYKEGVHDEKISS